MKRSTFKRDCDFFVAQIRQSEDNRKKLSEDYKWMELKDCFNQAGMSLATGVDGLKGDSGSGFLQEGQYVNWPWAFAEVFVPSVYYRQPYVTVASLRTAYAGNAKVAEAYVNQQLKRTKFRREAKLVIKDNLVYGHGWLKLGWYSTAGQVPESEAPDMVIATSLKQRDIGMQFAPGKEYAYRVSPEQMLVDPVATRYEDCGWMAQEYWYPWDILRADKDFKDDDIATKYTYQPTGDIFEPMTKNPMISSVRSWAHVYEIWDREENKVYLWCEGSKDFNKTWESFPYKGLYGFPFKYLALTEGVDKFLPPSQILAWFGLVDELGFYRTTRMEHIRKMVKKFLTSMTALSEEQMTQFLDPKCEVLRVNDPSPTGIREIDGMKPDASLYMSEQQVTQDIREISGFSELMAGATPGGRTTATTAAIAAQYGGIRFDHATEMVRVFILECASDLFRIGRQYGSFPATVVFSGAEHTASMDINAVDLEGDFAFECNVEDISKVQRETKIKRAYDTLVALAPFNGIVDVRALIHRFLNAQGDADVDEILLPPAGPPLDPTYEESLLMRGIPVDPNPGEDLELHMTSHQAMLSSPQYRMIAQQAPIVVQVVNEHLQKTLQMAAQRMQSMPGGGAAKPGISPSIQQGQRLASSTPPMGPTGAAGPEMGAQQLAGMSMGGM